MTTVSPTDSAPIKAYKDYASSTAFLTSPLPIRFGPRPKVKETLPHFQMEEQSPDDVFESLTKRATEMLGDNIKIGHSTASLPSTFPSFFLCGHCPMPEEASMTPGGPRQGREFAHIHTKYSPDANPRNQGGGQGSMHVCLSLKDAATVIDSRCGERHLKAGEVYNKKWGVELTMPRGMVLVYAPRNEKEVDTVLRILEASYLYAQSEK
jgi:hypothetical protein